MANNINQLTRRANAGKLTGFPAATMTAASRRNQTDCGTYLLGLVGEDPMIGKTTKGKGFKGALAYTLAAEKGALLDTNMDGATPG